DYTLLMNDGSLPPLFDSYVDKMKEAGIQFAVASGRPGYTLQELFPEYRDDFYFISDNGACITHKGKVIYKSLMEEDIIEDMTRTVLEETPGCLPMICALNGGYYPVEGVKYQDFFSRFFSKQYPVKNVYDVQEETNKFTVFCPNGDAKDIMNDIYVPKYGENYNVTLGGDVWIDIQNKGINKGSAMKQLETLCCIDKDEIWAFGDHLNDLEMLDYIPHSYAMANAIPEIKKVANYMAPSNEECGVLKVLDTVL
nr:HAD family hydrolase [Lachnospiraceae bacterium]